MKYLTREDIIGINRCVIKLAGQGESLLQYPQGLDIVIKQPQQFVFGRELYSNIWLKAAFILQKITKKHIFVDGNKRTAILTMMAFLHINGYEIAFTDNDAEKMILAVTNLPDDEEVMLGLAEWIKERGKSFCDKY